MITLTPVTDHMRPFLLLITLLCCRTMFGQWAIGIHTGIANDHVEGTNTPSFGFQVEHRFSDSSRFSFRLSMDAVGLSHRGSSTQLLDSEGQVLGYLHVHTERERLAGYLDTRYALTEAECMNGYFRGAYALAGIGLLGTSATQQRWTSDTLHMNGPVTSNRTFSTSIRLRLGAGAQWSFSWGALFGEVLVTAGNERDAADHQVLLTSLGVQAGYRYVFKRK